MLLLSVRVKWSVLVVVTIILVVVRSLLSHRCSVGAAEVVVEKVPWLVSVLATSSISGLASGSSKLVVIWLIVIPLLIELSIVVILASIGIKWWSLIPLVPVLSISILASRSLLLVWIALVVLVSVAILASRSLYIRSKTILRVRPVVVLLVVWSLLLTIILVLPWL